MDKWILFTKLMILIAGTILAGHDNNQHIPQVLLVVLAYISLNVFHQLIAKVTLQRFTRIAIILLVLVTSKIYNSFFIFLLPIELFTLIANPNWAIGLTIIPLIFPILTLPSNWKVGYILVGILSFVIYHLAKVAGEKVGVLSKENDELRESNYRLRASLNQDMEYARQIKYLSQLEERNKLSQEIHDKLGHTVAGSLLQLEAAKVLIINDQGKAMELTQNVIDLLRDGMENIRLTLRSIKPSSEELGVNRIKLLLDKFTVEQLMKINFWHKGDLDKISFQYWKIIYENINESLTNALRYSKASLISVNIQVLNKIVKVEVKDNGMGADSYRKGLGITGMEERAEGLGGQLIIHGKNGFSVTTILPLEEHNVYKSADC